MSDDANRWEPPVEDNGPSGVFDNDSDYASAAVGAASESERGDAPGAEEDALYDEPGVILTDEEIEVLAETPDIPPRLPLVAIIGGALIALLLVLLLWRVVASRTAAPAQPAPQPTTIRALQPTFTPTPSLEPPAVLPDAPSTPTATPEPTPSPTPTTEEGVQVGKRVRVAGTEAEGVRFRTGPGVEYVTLAILFDGAELLVVGGPEQSAGFTWWRVQDEDGTIGWIIADVLEPVR